MRKQFFYLTALLTGLFFSLAVTAQPAADGSAVKKMTADSLAKSNVVGVPAMNEDSGDLDIFTKVDIEASVDRMRWRRHLEKKLKSPIENAAKLGMKAGYHTVMIRFVVEKDGSVADVKAMNDPGYGLAEASVTVLKTGPRWAPGEQAGRKVRSYFTQPITFVISEK